MPIVKMLNKKTGITYVYESESFWDKEKQQPRNRRKLIGKIDPDTGQIVPTGKSGRKASDDEHDLLGQVVEKKTEDSPVQPNLISVLDERNEEISALKKKVRELESKCEHYEILIDRIRGILDNE